jgi:hypothetical protein
MYWETNWHNLVVLWSYNSIKWNKKLKSNLSNGPIKSSEDNFRGTLEFGKALLKSLFFRLFLRRDLGSVKSVGSVFYPNPTKCYQMLRVDPKRISNCSLGQTEHVVHMWTRFGYVF